MKNVKQIQPPDLAPGKLNLLYNDTIGAHIRL